MSDRIEEIRERAARMRFDDAYDPGAEDVSYLLARIEALTLAGDGLAEELVAHNESDCANVAVELAAWEKAKGHE